MNIQKLMKEAQKAQRKMAEAQERLADLSVEGSSGGGLVTVTAGGDGTVTGIKIDPSTVDPEDVDLLEDLITAAVNEAQRKAKELQETELGDAMGGLGGLGGLF
ncbi:MAG: YbaB/EbfC family nucleoid-associated protein [Trueperaceae bacterium]|nr:MAG: YbaB/EbfC family nucleoid-associated protein [Trueperaceae bacterium]